MGHEQVTFQSSDIIYSTYKDFIEYFNRRAAGRLDLPSGLRGGFTHKPIGGVESMTVTHSYINITRWFLKGMAISESRWNVYEDWNIFQE